MSEYTATSKLPSETQLRQALKNDPYANAVYRANSLTDLTAIVDTFGITDPQHKAAMLGMMKLNWILLRRLAKIIK